MNVQDIIKNIYFLTITTYFFKQQTCLSINCELAIYYYCILKVVDVTYYGYQSNVHNQIAPYNEDAI